MEDKSQILYQKLIDKGLYSKSYDDFVTQFSDDTKRIKLHEVLSAKGLYSKPVEDFNEQFFAPLILKKKEPTVEDYLPTPENVTIGRKDSSEPASPSVLTSPPKKTSPIEETAEKYYTEKGWPSPTKKMADYEAGVSALKSEIAAGRKTPEQAKEEAVKLANDIGLNYNPETGGISVSPMEVDMYREQLDKAYYQNLNDKAAKEKEGFFKDVLDNLNIGANAIMTSPKRMMAISERLSNAVIGLIDRKDRLSSTYWQDKAAVETNISDQWRENNARYDGSITGMIQSGDMAGAVGQTVMSVAENLPLLATLALGNAAGATNATLGFMGADKAADEYLRSASTDDIPEVARIINAIGKGMSEVVFESIGTVSILNSVRKGIAEAGQQTLRNQLVQSYTPFFQRQLSLLSKGSSAMIREGGSEMATQLTDNLFDIAVGRDVKLMDGVGDAGIVGAVIGVGMVSPQMIAEYKGGQSALVKQVIRSIPDNLEFESKLELAELLVESAQLKYDKGKGIAGMDVANKVRLDEIQTRVGSILGLPTEAPTEAAGEQKAQPPKPTAPAEEVTKEETPVSEAPQVPEEIVRTKEGDVAQMAAPVITPPTPELQAEAVDEIRRLNSLSKGQFVVPVNDAGTLPGFSKQAAQEFKQKPNMRALHIKGDTKSYINLDRITSIDDVRRAWLHEAGIHGGIERLFPTKEEYTSSMFGVLNNIGGREATLDKIVELGGDKASYRSQTDAMVAEEYLAFLSRKIITDPNLSAEKVLAPDELTWWQQFFKTIGDAIKKQFGVAITMTDADIANLVIDATQTAISERGRKTETVFKGRDTSAGEMMAEEVTPTEVPGEQKKTQIFTAPRRKLEAQSLSDQAPFDDPKYGELLTTLENISTAMGFPVPPANKYIGLWAEAGDVSFEGSTMVSIPTTDTKSVNLFSALAGTLAFDVQNSVMRVRYEVGAEGKMHVFEFKDSAMADALVSDMREMLGTPEFKDAGVGQGASFAISEKKLYIGVAKETDFDKFRELINKHKDGIADTQIADADISFFGEADYEGVLREHRAEAEGRDGGAIGNDIDNLVTLALGKLEGAAAAEVEAKAEPSPRAKKLKDIINKSLIKRGPSEQRRIDEAYKIGKAEGVRAEKEAKESYKDFSKQIADILKEADFKNNLTDFQSRTLVNAARRVVDEKSLGKFFEVVDRVVDNREHKAQMNAAKKNQKAIRNRTRDGQNVYGADVQRVFDFVSLPIRYEDFSIEALREYNAIAEMLLEGRVPAEGIVALKKYVPPEIAETKSTGIYRQIQGIKNQEDFEAVMESLGAIEIASIANYNRVMRLAEAVKAQLDTLTDLDGEVVEGLYSQLESFTDAVDNTGGEIKVLLEEQKSATIDEMAEMRAFVDMEQFDYAEIKEEIKKFLNLSKDDLMLLSPKQIRLYAQIMTGMTYGFVNKEMPQFMDAIGQASMETIWTKVQDKLESSEFSARQKFFDKLNKMGLSFIARWIEPIMTKDNVYLTNYISLRNLGSIDEKVLGMHKQGRDQVERPTYEKYIMPIVRAIQQAERATTIAVNNYWNVAHKVSRTNRMLAGILMVEKDFRSNPIVIAEGPFKGEYTWDTLPIEEKKDLTRWSLTQYETARIPLAELAKYREMLVMDTDGNIDIEASVKKIAAKDKNFVKLMDISRQIFDAHKGKARFAAEMRGVIFGDEGPNYTPRIVRQDNVGRGDSEFSIEHIDKMFSPFAAIRKRAKATYERTHGRFVVEYDLDNIVGMHIMDVNRDFYLSRPLGIANRSLRNVARVTTNSDVKLFSNALRNAVADRVKTEFSESSARWLSKLIAWRRMLALVSLQRPAMELFANTVRYFMVNPSAIIDNTRAMDRRWRGVVDHMNSPLSMKLSRWSPEGVAGMSMEDIRARNDEKATMATIFKDTRKAWAERMGEWFYTFADTQMGRVVYAHEFNQAFKKKTGKSFDFDAFSQSEAYALENAEAMAYADAMAFAMMEELYNSQSWITTPSKVKFIPGMMDREVLSSKKGGWAKVFGYMQSFNFNETEQTLKYMQTIMRPGVGPEAKMEAGRKIAAFAVSNYVYMATMGAAARFISASIASALDGDDDDYWADVWDGMADYFTLESQSKLLIGSLITLGMGRYGGVARELTSVAWGGLQYLFPDSKFVKSLISGTQMTMYVQPLDFNRRYRPDQMMDKLGGVAGDIAAEMTRMGMNVADIIKKVNEDGVSALSPDEREFWLLMSAFNQTAALIAPNFMSPLVERAIKAKTYDLTADYSVEPSVKVRTIPWAGKKIDIYELYKLEPHRGIAGNTVVVPSTGNRTGNEVKITDTEKKRLQQLATDKFDGYVNEYLRANGTRIGSESYGAISEAMTERVQEDMNALWTKAKAQARYETFEYPGLKTGGGYARVQRYGAIPRPISSWEQDGKNILMDSPALSRKVNGEYFKIYIERFRIAFPTDADIQRAQRGGTFDKDINKLMSEAMAEAKNRTTK